ncbi:hypothetical protein C725_1045 [Pacificimonas flava]|uniref:Uncharacterized protein n=1 Tax=Pacificimonas flava TaxID=1234595 RepID=M2T9B5_9SPHN|nr:hypothetical protein C725_1045 [Pacificimonas flava]
MKPFASSPKEQPARFPQRNVQPGEDYARFPVGESGREC